MRQFLRHQIYSDELKRKSLLKNETRLMRFQAYERLVLFCERIRIANLIVRLQSPNMTNKTLKNAIVVSIQKEYEHNLTQQLYTSPQLWEMIELLKDQTLAVVTGSFLKHEKGSLDKFVEELLEKDQIIEKNFGLKVKTAIRKEVELYFQ